ncbi:MAG: class I SAM-dependent methyltransferase [Ginsengibacter sp.]
MGYVSFSLPKEIVLEFKNEAKFQNFIETGTYKGGSSYWAARHFDNVYTIEIDPEISKATASRPECPENIEFLVGNSKDVLPELVENIHSPSLFWLDGHWCNISEVGKDMECPLIDEIKALKNFQSSVILIDDARAFLGPLPPPHDDSQWPRIDEIILLLKAQFPDNLVTIADDVIYCIPPSLIPVYDKSWIKYYGTRFGNKKTIFHKIGRTILKSIGLRK